jgi:hypothetical protein
VRPSPIMASRGATRLTLVLRDRKHQALILKEPRATNAAGRAGYSRTLRNRSAFAITVTLDSVIAALAIIGLRNASAAIGMPMTL